MPIGAPEALQRYAEASIIAIISIIITIIIIYILYIIVFLYPSCSSLSWVEEAVSAPSLQSARLGPPWISMDHRPTVACLRVARVDVPVRTSKPLRAVLVV